MFLYPASASSGICLQKFSYGLFHSEQIGVKTRPIYFEIEFRKFVLIQIYSDSNVLVEGENSTSNVVGVLVIRNSVEILVNLDSNIFSSVYRRPWLI